MDKKIIKPQLGTNSSASAAVQGKIVTRELYEATVKARDVMEEAQREAQEILASAEQERKSIFNVARQQGYQEGLSCWNQAILEAQLVREKLEKVWEEDLLRLAVRMAEKIIGEQLYTAPGTIVQIVREALKGIRRGHNLTLQVNPQHLEVLQQRLDSLQDSMGMSREIYLLGNPAIAPGGCIAESELGIVDAQLETQLKCLEEALLRASKR